MAGGNHWLFGALLHHWSMLLSDWTNSHEVPEAPWVVATAAEGPAHDCGRGSGVLHLLVARKCLHQHPAAAGHS